MWSEVGCSMSGISVLLINLFSLSFRTRFNLEAKCAKFFRHWNWQTLRIEFTFIARSTSMPSFLKMKGYLKQPFTGKASLCDVELINS